MIPSIIVRIFHLVLWSPLRLAFIFFLHLKIQGQENLSQLPSGFIIAANHSSIFDPFIISDSFPLRVRFFPQRYAMHHRFFRFPRFLIGWTMSLLGAYPIRPGLGVKKAIAPSIKALSKKEKILIFPRGKVSTIGRPRNARPGVAYMAHKSGKIILPVYIKGAKRMKFTDFLLRRRRVTVIFGQPFYLSDVYPRTIQTEQDLRQVARAVMVQIEKLKHYI